MAASALVDAGFLIALLRRCPFCVALRGGYFLIPACQFSTMVNGGREFCCSGTSTTKREPSARAAAKPPNKDARGNLNRGLGVPAWNDEVPAVTLTAMTIPSGSGT